MSESYHSFHSQICLSVFCWTLCSNIFSSTGTLAFARNSVHRALNYTKPQMFSSLNCVNGLTSLFPMMEGRTTASRLPHLLPSIHTQYSALTWTSLSLHCFVSVVFGLSWCDGAYVGDTRKSFILEDTYYFTFLKIHVRWSPTVLFKNASQKRHLKNILRLLKIQERLP